MFDFNFYLQFYPDLKKNGIIDAKSALDHWNNYGKKAGRICNKNQIKIKEKINIFKIKEGNQEYVIKIIEGTNILNQYYLLNNNLKIFFNISTYYMNGLVKKLYKIIKNNLYIYNNLKNSDGGKYIKNKNSNDSIIFNGAYPYGCNSRFYFLTKSSVYTKYTKFTNISNEKFNYISDNYIKFNDNISFKDDGDIIIYMPNFYGWYKDFLKIEKLNNLIKNIRSRKKNRIIVRLHHKNCNDKYKNLIKNIINGFENVLIDLQEIKWENIFDNCYCIFIQNSTMILILFSYGIPIFNLDEIFTFNSFPDLSIKFDFLNDFKDELAKIDRRNLLKKYYSSVCFADDPLEEKTDFMLDFYKRNF